MTFAMNAPSHHDFIGSYESAIKGLESAPDNRVLQHQAVLALARMGSLDLALSEYERYGLSSVRNHEDIMALGARLSKDLYLATSGAASKQHGLNSAQKYEAAYNDTRGYYSGINSATMALLADMPGDIVKSRALHIQKTLPPVKNLTPTDYYFIEATRAECFLLLDDIEGAVKSLRLAIDFDPLNYTAHATTLKQFRLIQRKKQSAVDWLEEFMPPRPAHFAGHIWNHESPPSRPLYENMLNQISDAIQQNDIGYGFGALAAGADIVIAERLIQEGAELHVILPSGADNFVETSVRPFGSDWVPRFAACMKQAASTKIMHLSSQAKQEDLYLIAGNVAMGQAIIKGQQFDVEAAQVLILDDSVKGSMTTLHSAKWQKTTLPQILVPASLTASQSKSLRRAPKELDIVMMISGQEKTQNFTSLGSALKAAREMLTGDETLTIALAYAYDDVEATLAALTARGLSASILMSYEIAASVALSETSENVGYAGIIKGAFERMEHVFTMRR